MMGLWPQRTEVSMMPARLSVTTSLLPDDYDWLHDEAHRVGVSMSRIVADIISDYRVSLAAADAYKGRTFGDGSCCMKDHANATPPWTCKCKCHDQALTDEDSNESL